MSPHYPASGRELAVDTAGNPWFLVETAKPGEGSRWLAYASIRAIVQDAGAGKLESDIYITAVLADENEPGCRSGFLRVRSIYRLGDTLYLAQTVDDSLLFDDGQIVRLMHPWGSS